MNVTFDPAGSPVESITTFGPGTTEVVDSVPAAARSITPAVCPAPVAPVAMVPVAAAPLATRKTLLGDYLPDFSDIIMPRLNIAQNIGDLSDLFPSGSLVLNRDVLLWEPPVRQKGQVVTAANPPVEIIVVGFRDTRYAEKTTGGAKGRILNTVQEVVAAGGTIEYSEAKALGKPLYQPLAEAVILIRKPAWVEDKDNNSFSFDIPEADGAEGKWALALWSLKGSSYTDAGKKVLFKERRLGFLNKGGYPSRHFAISTIEKDYGDGKAAWVPVLIATKHTAPETTAWIANLLV